MNNDLLINKILYYLSQLPIEYSFHKMQPKLRYVCQHVRFIDYLNSWLTSTSQMKQVRVLYTDMEPGCHLIKQNIAYLTKGFFDEYPTEQPQKDLLEEKKMMSEPNQFGINHPINTYETDNDDDDNFKPASSLDDQNNEAHKRKSYD